MPSEICIQFETLFSEVDLLLAAPRAIEQQFLDEIISADNFLETTPPIDENFIINEQVIAQESDDEPEPKPVRTQAQFISNLANMKDYLCLHGFSDWKSFNSISNFSTNVSSNVAKRQSIIDHYFQN